MFNHHSFGFLEKLTLNNNKQWFLEHSHQYQEHLIQPCKQLIETLGFFILTIDENLETNPVVNKCLTTIYRDLRYSKNKRPFKTHMGINFRKKTNEWKKYPAFFFRISPEGYYFGLTIMKNDSNHFEAFRREIDRDPLKFQKVIQAIESNTNLHVRGDDYKKFSFNRENAQIQKYYSKKNMYISCFKDKNAFRNVDELAEALHRNFEDLSGLYTYFSQTFLKAKDENVRYS